MEIYSCLLAQARTSQLKTDCSPRFRVTSMNVCFHAWSKSRFLSVKSFTNSADTWDRTLRQTGGL